MRIITGTARGRRLITVPGNDLVRPTSEKVKEGIFSSIQFDIEGRRVLDLFAGSGQLGLEALSRGAVTATFVDSSEVSLGVLRKNIDSTGFNDQSNVIRSDFNTFALRCNDRYDIAFIDPPYSAGLFKKAIEAVCPIMSDYGIIICEHPSDVSLPEVFGSFKLSKMLGYGRICVSIYRCGGDADE